MSLELKCKYLEEKTGHKLERHQLKTLYERNGIRYLSAKAQSHASYHNDGKDLEREEFCMDIGKKYIDNEALIFMDETTVKLDYQIKKCWQNTKQRMMLCTNTYPKEVVTIYGCVSRVTKKPIMWYMERTTNKLGFLKFCR